MASPITEPRPTKTLSKPFGSPACSKIFGEFKAIKDVASAGLRITAFPAAIAGLVFELHWQSVNSTV